jgi:hypothetical protein
MATSFFEIFEQGFTNPNMYKNIEKSFDLELLRTTLKNIIDSHPEQIRSMIDNQDSYTYSKSFQIAPKANWIYKNPFNHNGEYIYFFEERIMVTVDNFSKTKSTDHYVMKVFRNGELLKEGDDYSVKICLGSRRIFIKAALINEFDVIHVTARRIFNLSGSGFYTIDAPSSYYPGNFTFLAHEYNFGKIFENAENLSVFIKKMNEDNFTYLTRNVDYTITRLSTLQVQVKMMIAISISDQILVINKLSAYKLEYTTGNQSNDQEYFDNNNFLSIPLRVYNDNIQEYLPFPVENVNEVDLWAAKGKLIPGVDYTIDLADPINKIPTLKLSSFFKKNSYILIENRLWDPMYNVVNVLDEVGNTTGFIPFVNAKIPVDNRYVEVFLGRRKVPETNISNIGDILLKVDGQRCLQLVDCRSALLVSELFKFLNNGFASNQSKLAEAIKYQGIPEFIADYTAEYSPSVNLDDVEPLDPFLPQTTPVELRLHVSQPTFVSGIEDPVFTVMLELENGTLVDVTADCLIEIQEYTDLEDELTRSFIAEVTYKVDDTTTLTSTIQFQMIEKEIYGIFIELESAVVLKNAAVNYKVFCNYFDNTRRDITESTKLVVTVPPTDTVGGLVIDAAYTIGGNTYHDNKNFAVVDYKVVDHLEIIPEKTNILTGETVAIQVIAHFKDGTTLDITDDPTLEITGYIPGVSGSQTITAEWPHGSVYTAQKVIEFVIKPLPISVMVENSEYSVGINVTGQPSAAYNTYLLFKKDVALNTWVQVIAHPELLADKALLICPIETGSEMKIQFFDINGQKVDTVYNDINKVIFIKKVLSSDINYTLTLDATSNLIVTFTTSIDNAIISLNGFYYKYTQLQSNQIRFNRYECTFDLDTLSNNTIQVHKWNQLLKDTATPISEASDWYTFAENLPEIAVIIAYGKMYDFEYYDNSGTLDYKKIRLLNCDISDIPVSDILAVVMHPTNNLYSMRRDLLTGVNNIPLATSTFTYNLEDAIINYDGLNIPCTLANQAPLTNNKVVYDVPGVLPVFENLPVNALIFGYNETNNYIDIGI